MMGRRNPTGNPKEDREADLERRREAQARKPLIAKWAPDIPTGYIHVDDAIEYMHRRWGKALRAEVFERFSTDEGGPKYVIMGDYPDKSRGERYYKFDDIDMWVYRTFSGVPASWKETRRIKSSVPVTQVTDLQEALRRPLLDGTRMKPDGDTFGENGHREQEGDGRTGSEEDGWRRN